MFLGFFVFLFCFLFFRLIGLEVSLAGTLVGLVGVHPCGDDLGRITRATALTVSHGGGVVPVGVVLDDLVAQTADDLGEVWVLLTDKAIKLTLTALVIGEEILQCCEMDFAIGAGHIDAVGKGIGGHLKGKVVNGGGWIHLSCCV